MKTSSKILLGFSAVLLAVFAFMNVADYSRYAKGSNSAPFDLAISLNALYFVLPAAVFAAIALFLERKPRVLAIFAAVFAVVSIEEIIRQIAVERSVLSDGLLLAIPYIFAAAVFFVFAIICKKRGK